LAPESTGKDAPVKETKVISLKERAKDEAKRYLETHRERRSDAGQRAIVRNGRHPERELVTGVGPTPSLSFSTIFEVNFSTVFDVLRRCWKWSFPECEN
jgi:hypothetical protein